ncbi:hypothetical protein [Nonomuraea sp. NPDC003804]|uniref:hypothetical protein n=1 Tax=Nonomuraea sp. NPDC003804 TaxID=3154547 RepID=UPI0033B5E1AF
MRTSPTARRLTAPARPGCDDRSGKRLFEEGIAQVPLKLLKSAQFATGVLHLTYERA